jgi:putative ABC transport system permease protein
MVINVALRSLRRTPLRSGLTTLGIVIGVAAVIAMVSIGNGAKARVAESLTKLNPAVIILGALMPLEQTGRSSPVEALPGAGLTPDDYEAIRVGIKNAVRFSPRIYAHSSQAQANGRGKDVSITGIDLDGIELFSSEVLSGAGFAQRDISQAASVCLITRFLAEFLFPSQQAYGKLVRLNGIPFQIIGIVKDDETIADPRKPQSGDASVFVPFTSLLRRLDRNAQMAIFMEARSPQQVAALQREVGNLMEERRGTRKSRFQTSTAAQAIRFYSESSRTMALLLAAIAGISLLVGGIGIMNIMLVNVSERTREIGIRLAIGTRNRDILQQFLIEAIILSLVGGLIGVLFGIGGARFIAYLNAWPMEVTPGSILVALLFSSGIGAFFGYYPARQAAQLDPITALRSE